MTGERWIDLICHPSTRSERVRAIAVLLRRTAIDELQLTFRLDGDVSRIRVPSPAVPRFATELWRHTCFEAFISIEGHPGYHEFNFAPSGEWTVYALRGYRDGGPIDNEALRPNIVVRSTPTRLELDAVVPLDSLSPIHPCASLRIGLAAVIETNEEVSYWALR